MGNLKLFIFPDHTVSSILLLSTSALLEDLFCYESKLKGLSNETTLVLSNTRELDRVPKTK